MARASAATFLVSGEHQRQAGRGPKRFDLSQRGDDERRDTTFHVAAAAAVQATRFHALTETPMLPCGRAERDGIDVPGKPKGRLVRMPTDSCHKACPRRRER